MSNDRMYLVGADDVSRAGSQMREAAAEMLRAAGNIAYALEAHQRWADDWLQRLQAILDSLRPGGPAI
jgi:hypothetical protein